jgi:hypothetical protein
MSKKQLVDRNSVLGTREFPEIYDIGAFQEKKMVGKFQAFGTTKGSGSGNGFEIKTKLLVLKCFYHQSGKEGKRRDTKTMQCSYTSFVPRT